MVSEADGSVRAVMNERIVEVPFVWKHLAALPTGSTVIELGCAQSYLSISMASLGYSVSAVDMVAYDLQHPNFSFRQGDFITMSFDGLYDAFVAVSVLEHAGLGYYGADAGGGADVAIMQKVRKLLREGGMAVITVPFGLPTVICKRGEPFQVVYDEPGLAGLFEGFSIEDDRYYYTLDQRVWQEGTRSDVAGVDNVRPGGRRVAAGVACVAAKRV